MSVLGIEAWQLALVAVTAFGVQIIGGLAGYGGGLILPLVLLPITGPEGLVPVIGLSALITNPTRAYIYREHLDVPKALRLAAYALPSTIVGAWFFTTLSGRGASLFIGLSLLAMVPLRRILERRRIALSGRGIAAAGVGYGFLTGCMSGAGIVLISILMSMGLSGAGVIATDSLASAILGVFKIGIYYAAGALPAKLWLIAGLIGAMATPGTLVARWIVRRYSARLHNGLIEAAVVGGACVLIGQAIWGQAISPGG